MATNFKLDSYFEIAVRMEENGERFYRRAAEIFEDEKTKKLLLALAEDEVAHRKTFQEFRRGLPAAQAVADGPSPVGVLTLLAMAECRFFAPDDEGGQFL